MDWDAAGDASGWIGNTWPSYLEIHTQANRDGDPAHPGAHYGLRIAVTRSHLTLPDLERLVPVLRKAEKRGRELFELEGSNDWATSLGQTIRSLGIQKAELTASITELLGTRRDVIVPVGVAITSLRQHWLRFTGIAKAS